MNRLDRHIAGRYLANVIAIFAILFSFVVAIDMSLNMRAFGKAATALRPDSGGIEKLLMMGWCVVDLWGPRLLMLSNYMMGFVLVAAMGFTCAQFVRHREFIAMLASGVSLRRLSRPILMVAVFVLLLGGLNQEFLLPKVSHLLPRDSDDAGRRSIQAFSVPLLKDSADRLWYAAQFDPDAAAMSGVQIWERDANGRPLRRVRAESATWDGAGWTLTEGSVVEQGATRSIDRVDSDLEPNLILAAQVEGYAESMSWRQIQATLRHGNVEGVARDRLNRVRFGRLSMMASTLLALMVSLPFFLVRVPKNMAAQSVKCAPLAGAALVGSALGTAQPLPGLPVWLGVFVPVIVLAPLAIWGFVSVRT